MKPANEELRFAVAEMQNATDLASHIVSGALAFLVEKGLTVEGLTVERVGEILLDLRPHTVHWRVACYEAPPALH